MPVGTEWVQLYNLLCHTLALAASTIGGILAALAPPLFPDKGHGTPACGAREIIPLHLFQAKEHLCMRFRVLLSFVN